MTCRLTTPALAALLLAPAVPLAAQGPTPPGARWPMHSLERPTPPVVRVGPAGPPAPPPPGAIVLFDGRSLDEWQSDSGGAAGWTVRRGVLTVRPGAGEIRTRRAFGDVQLHVEWSAPAPPRGEGQERGNSGVFLMDQYEIQVLDSYDNPTYADGMAGALYGQSPPLANPARPPGQWNVYDIVFRAPRFAPDGTLRDSARATVVMNGIVVQNNAPFWGRVAHMEIPHYTAHAARLPLGLQDHGYPVRFRNIWVRELPDLP